MSTDFFTLDEMPTYDGNTERVDMEILTDMIGPEAERMEGVEVPLHVWVQVGDTHHDVERPDGVSCFLDLPHFQRVIPDFSPKP